MQCNYKANQSLVSEPGLGLLDKAVRLIGQNNFEILMYLLRKILAAYCNVKNVHR